MQGLVDLCDGSFSLAAMNDNQAFVAIAGLLQYLSTSITMLGRRRSSNHVFYRYPHHVDTLRSKSPAAECVTRSFVQDCVAGALQYGHRLDSPSAVDVKFEQTFTLPTILLSFRLDRLVVARNPRVQCLTSPLPATSDKRNCSDEMGCRMRLRKRAAQTYRLGFSSEVGHESRHRCKSHSCFHYRNCLSASTLLPRGEIHRKCRPIDSVTNFLPCLIAFSSERPDARPAVIAAE